MWSSIWAEILLFTAGWNFLGYNSIAYERGWTIGNLALNHGKTIGLVSVTGSAVLSFYKYGIMGLLIVVICSCVLLVPLVFAVFKASTQPISFILLIVGLIASLGTL